MPIEPDGLNTADPRQLVCKAVHPQPDSPARRWLRALAQESGTATIEFCMVFPIVMFLILILVQSTLLMVGNQFVHYAAFAATRSAIVYIPADYSHLGIEGRNTIVPDEGSPKFDAIRAAAYLAVMPVCGKLDESNENLRTGEFINGLNEHFASYGQDSPRWVNTLAASRLRYAAENTDVQVLYSDIINGDLDLVDIAAEGHGYNFGPRESITVRVEHRLNLSVPYVRAIFADGEHADGLGKYANVTAHYTLTNEGVDTNLPEQPTDYKGDILPRNTN